MLSNTLQTLNIYNYNLVFTLRMYMFGTGIEVKAGKTKYMVISRVQNAGQTRYVKIGNSYFERVEKFKYLGKNLRNQNSIQEEVKSRLKSGNTCYHSA
jgi:hypothetical protein